jgi:SAM-dependent methyltransferase
MLAHEGLRSKKNCYGANRLRVYPMPSITARSPKEVVKDAHKGYYSAGEYSDDRYKWTIETFLPSCRGKRILEIGCGSGRLLKLLQASNVVVGVDASEDGIVACLSREIEGHCMDPSSEPLPFADETFDLVICLETMEHLMSPYYALMEMRRVLKTGGKLICSVPNPVWGHIMLYPGLFEYKFFRRFIEQCDLQILRVEPWEWAPRENILPPLLRKFALFRTRYVAGGLRRLVALAWRAFGGFPFFCYWLWTFEVVKVESRNKPLLTRQSLQTAPKG